MQPDTSTSEPRFVDDREAYLRIVQSMLEGNLRDDQAGGVLNKLGPKGKGDVSWHFRVAVNAQQILECMDRVYGSRKPPAESSSGGSERERVGGAW